MNRAHPADLRKALEIANALMKAGIDFVPVPVLSDEDKAILVRDTQIRLEQIKRKQAMKNDQLADAVNLLVKECHYASRNAGWWRNIALPHDLREEARRQGVLMTVTDTLLRAISDCERSTGEKPTEIHMTESSFLRLKAEVASDYLVQEAVDEPPMFNGVKLVIVD